MTNTATYNIHLPQFEGPFDLLLFFIERDELDINDIPIHKVTEDFLARYQEVQEQKETKTPAYFLLNMYKDSFNLHKAVVGGLEKLGEQYGVSFLKSKLHERVAYGEANVKGLGTIEHTDLKAKNEILELTKEIIEHAQKA